MRRDKRMLMFLQREYKKNRLRHQFVMKAVGFFKPKKDGWYVVSDDIVKKNLRLEKFYRGRWVSFGKYAPTFLMWYARRKEDSVSTTKKDVEMYDRERRR